MSTSSLLPRALRPEEKNNASTSSSIVREDGWCIVLRQASLFVFTINRDESPMDSPLKSPKYSFQLDFPASVSSIPSKNRFPACLFFGSDDSLPGVRFLSIRCISTALERVHTQHIYILVPSRFASLTRPTHSTHTIGCRSINKRIRTMLVKHIKGTGE